MLVPLFMSKLKHRLIQARVSTIEAFVAYSTCFLKQNIFLHGSEFNLYIEYPIRQKRCAKP